MNFEEMEEQEKLFLDHGRCEKCGISSHGNHLFCTEYGITTRLCPPCSRDWAREVRKLSAYSNWRDVLFLEEFIIEAKDQVGFNTFVVEKARHKQITIESDLLCAFEEWVTSGKL